MPSALMGDAGGAAISAAEHCGMALGKTGAPPQMSQSVKKFGSFTWVYNNILCIQVFLKNTEIAKKLIVDLNITS